MKPLRVWARNLRTWEALDVELPAGVTAVVGENGAGKSTLVNVIDLALFGSGREMKRAASRGEGVEEFECGVEFEHAGGLYRVRRSYTLRGAGKPRLDFERDAGGLSWISLSRETIDATEQELEALLGLSRQTFRASSYLAQGEGDAFTAAPPRERKAILLEALGVRLWDALRERAARERADHEHALARLLGQVEGLEGQLAIRSASEAALAAAAQDAGALRLAVADLERGAADLRQELGRAQEQEAAAAQAQARARSEAARLDDAERAAAAVRARLDAAEGREADRERLEAEARLQPLLEALVELRSARAAKEDAAERLEALTERASLDARSATEQADAAGERAAVLERELAVIRAEGASCPVCSQELRGEALAAASAQVAARLSAAENERDGAFAKAQAAREREAEAHRSREEREREILEAREAEGEASARLPEAAQRDPRWALAQAREAEARLAGLAEVREAAERDRAQLAELEQGLPALRLAKDAAAQAAAEAASPVDAGALRQRAQAAEAQLQERRAALSAAEAQEARARGELERLEGVELELIGLRADLASAKDEAALRKLAERAYSRDGIPALILEAAALPQLEAEANRLIGEFGRGYRFELRTQRETKQGDLREALDIVVHTEQGEAAYEDFSGGERTRLDLALRIALARLLAARRGADIRLLAIDEPAYLDAEGFGRLAAALRGLASEFDVVLVVSHVSELRDAFDQALVVEGGADTGEPSRLEEAA